MDALEATVGRCAWVGCPGELSPDPGPGDPQDNAPAERNETTPSLATLLLSTMLIATSLASGHKLPLGHRADVQRTRWPARPRPCDLPEHRGYRHCTRRSTKSRASMPNVDRRRTMVLPPCSCGSRARDGRTPTWRAAKDASFLRFPREAEQPRRQTNVVTAGIIRVRGGDATDFGLTRVSGVGYALAPAPTNQALLPGRVGSACSTEPTHPAAALGRTLGRSGGLPWGDTSSLKKALRVQRKRLLGHIGRL